MVNGLCWPRPCTLHWWMGGRGVSQKNPFFVWGAGVPTKIRGGQRNKSGILGGGAPEKKMEFRKKSRISFCSHSAVKTNSGILDFSRIPDFSWSVPPEIPDFPGTPTSWNSSFFFLGPPPGKGNWIFLTHPSAVELLSAPSPPPKK